MKIPYQEDEQPESDKQIDKVISRLRVQVLDDLTGIADELAEAEEDVIAGVSNLADKQSAMVLQSGIHDMTRVQKRTLREVSRLGTAQTDLVQVVLWLYQSLGPLLALHRLTLKCLALVLLTVLGLAATDVYRLLIHPSHP